MESAVNQDTRFEGRSVSLYQQDFEDLTVIFAKAFNSVEVRSPEFKYKTFDEFLQNKRDVAPKELTVELRQLADEGYGYKYQAEIRIRPRTFTVVTYSQRMEAIGAVACIFRFLDTKPRSRKLFHRKAYVALNLIGYGMILGVLFILAASDFKWHTFYLAASLTGSLLYSSTLWPGFPWRNKLRPQTQRNAVSWFEDNKDKIIVGVIISILTIFATKLAPLLISHIVLK